MDNSLENLKDITRQNIEQKKQFTPKIQDRFAPIDDYYLHYLKKTVDKNHRPPHAKDSKGDVVKYAATPVHHKNTLLAMAFSKAEKLYSELRGEAKVEAGEQQLFSEDEINNAVAGDDEPLSAIEALTMSKHLLGGKNKSLVKGVKQGRMHELNEFNKVLPQMHKALKELRNYHAHILHEPGPVQCANLFGDISLPKKLKTEEWAMAKEWFMGRWDDARQHLINSLEKRIADKDFKENKPEDYEKVLGTISGYTFERDGRLTYDALLFIACLFLRKGDAEYFVKKWTGAKKPSGVFRTTQTFFTMYSVKDSKSLHTQNNSLLNFRKIIGQLGTAPYFENECFRPFNKYIADQNSQYAQKADKATAKRDKEKWNSYVIPQRKGFSPAKWYLACLADKGLLADFEIACYKTAEDRLYFLKDNGIDTDMPAFKLKIKMATGDEKRRLTAIYKQAKRNFLFKVPGSTVMDYCIKNDNAILRYKVGGVWVQFTASADLLMKWLFADMKFGKGKEIKKKICTALKNQYYALAHNNYDKAPLGLPPSLHGNTQQAGIKYDLHKAENKINVRLQKLNTFLELNEANRAPWKFATKRKMDYIFEYVHLAYTHSAVAENKTTDQRRHDALNDTEYLQAMHYIRFYGRYYNMQEFRDFFFKEKGTYFSSIRGCIDKSQRLEELFNAVAQKLIDFYEKKILIKLSDGNLDRFAQVFRLRQPPQPGAAERHTPLFAVNQVVEHGFIDIAKMAEDSEGYKEHYTKWVKTIKDRERTTDFSFIRHWLADENTFDTNTDYIMKVIMPTVMGRLPKKDNGALKGGTSLFNTLMKNKTDELMLWEVAKYYWQKTYEKPYHTDWHRHLTRGESIKDKPYKKHLFFYHVFSQELLVDLGDGIKVKIKPKKFDDEFQYYENAEVKKYITQYKPPKKDGYWHYEDLNKNIKDNIAKYLDDAYLMLIVEKQVVQDNYDSLTGILHSWFKNGEAQGYYMEFGNAGEKVADGAPENTIVNLVYNAINPEGKNYNLKDLILCRNKIMHQQVQPDKEKYSTIRSDLITYCAAKELLELYKRPADTFNNITPTG